MAIPQNQRRMARSSVTNHFAAAGLFPRRFRFAGFSSRTPALARSVPYARRLCLWAVWAGALARLAPRGLRERRAGCLGLTSGQPANFFIRFPAQPLGAFPHSALDDCCGNRVLRERSLPGARAAALTDLGSSPLNFQSEVLQCHAVPEAAAEKFRGIEKNAKYASSAR
jgi:hypothetical protein